MCKEYNGKYGKTLHRQPKIELQEPQYKSPEMNSDAPE